MKIERQLTSLLDVLDEAYQRSNIRSVAAAEGREWAYSLIAGACERECPLKVGFNWGAKADTDYTRQDTIEKTSWADGDRGSLIRIVPYISRYFPTISPDQISQTNFCFFRSKKEAQISSGDLQLCWPIFDELLRILRPRIVLCFSSRLRDHLVETQSVGKLEKKMIGVSSGKEQRKYTALSGMLGGAPIAFLPHPNYPMKREMREAAWHFCARSH